MKRILCWVFGHRVVKTGTLIGLKYTCTRCGLSREESYGSGGMY